MKQKQNLTYMNFSAFRKTYLRTFLFAIIISSLLVFSFPAVFVTAQTSTIPNTPHILSVVSQSPNVTISWTDNSTNELRFEIYRGTSSLSMAYVAQVSANVTSYNDNGLAAGSYYYNVAACNTAGCSIGSDNGPAGPVTVYDTSPPSTPPVPALSILSSSQINLSWPASSDNVGVTGYKIYRCTCGNTASMVFLTNVTGTSYSDTGLLGFTTYTYAIAAYDAAGNISAQGPAASGTTFAGTGGSVPAVPSSANVFLNGSAINLTWIDNSNNETRFEIYRQANNGSWVYYTQVGANISGYAETPAAGTYSYKVAACNGQAVNTGCSASSSVAGPITVGGTSGDTTAPSAPTNLIATVSGSSVNLSWTDNSNNETGFKIYRGPTWTDIGNAGTNITSYTDSGLAAGTYTYHLNAFNSSSGTPVYSGVSNDVSVTIASTGTSSDTQAPSLPALPAISVVSSSQINLSWPASSDNVGVTGYKIYRCTCGNTVNMVYLTSVTTLNFQDMGLLGATSYTYAIAAYDAAGNVSNQGPAATGTTFSGNTTDTIPPAITSGSIRAENIIGDGAQIKWGTNENSNSKVEYGTTAGSYPQVSENRCDANGFVLDHCVNLTQLVANSRYYYRVKSADAAGNLIASTEFSFISGTGSTVTTDTLPPTAPTGLVATLPTTSLRVDLAWGAASDNTGVVGYKIYRNGAFLTNSSSLTFADNSVTGLTIYNYRVAAYDGAGNVSSFSNEVQITTPVGTSTAPDTTVPRITEFTSNLTNGGNNVVFRVKFSEPISGSSINNDSFFVYPVTYPNYKVPGSLMVGSDVVELTTLNLPDVDHVFVVTVNVKDLANNALVEFRSSTIRLHSTSPTYPYPPTTAVANPVVPYVKSWGLSVDATGNSISGVGFNAEMDQSTLTPQNIFLFKAGDASQTALPVTLEKFPFFVNLKTQTPLVTGTEYVSMVRAGVRSLSGASLAEFSCRFIAQALGSYTSCPGTGTAANPVLVFNSALAGTVTDSTGLAIGNVNVHVFTDDFSQNFGGTTSNTGFYKLILPPGVYNVEFFPPWDRKELIKPSLQRIELRASDSKEMSARMNTRAQSNRIIAGTVKFSDGSPVTDAQISAYNENTHFWVDSITDSLGNYKLSVGAGLFKVSFRPLNSDTASWQWPGIFSDAFFPETEATDTKTLNFTVPLSLKVIVKAVDQLGNPIPNAGIMLDSNGSFTTATANVMPPQFRKTDNAGSAIFSVPSGIYYVRGFLTPELGFINPPEQSIAVTTQTAASLIFRRREAASTIVINGIVKLANGTLVSNAFVWAWSENGGFANSRANDKGEFSLNTTQNDQWHVGAGKEFDNVPYKSVETSFVAQLDLQTIEIVLTKYSNQLPQTVTVARPRSESIIAQANDGAQVMIPANAAGSGSGTINVQMTPTVEAPSQAAARIIGKVWDVGIKDQTGIDIKKFSDKLEITFPYNDDDLKKEGTSADKLQPNYYDDTSGAWVEITDYSLDTNKKAFVLRVNHLTRFALVAPADITPPSTPTGLVYALTGAKEVTLSWVDPKADFHHTKIYRTVSKTDLGDSLSDLLTTSSYKDTSVAIGKTYYYYLESVDAAGNTSKVSELLKVAVTGSVSEPSTASGVSPDKYPSGLLFKYADNPTVYLLKNGIKYPITDFSVFKNYVSGNRSIVTIPSSVTFESGSNLSLKSGTLIKAKSAATVYLVIENKKRPFTSAEEFLGLGYGFHQIQAVDDTAVAAMETTDNLARPSGTIFKYAGKSTIYLLEDGKKRAFPSLTIVKTWIDPVYVITVADTEVYPDGSTMILPSGVLVKGTSATIYLVFDGTLRPLATSKVMTNLGFKSSQVIKLSASDLKLHPVGESIK